MSSLTTCYKQLIHNCLIIWYFRIKIIAAWVAVSLSTFPCMLSDSIQDNYKSHHPGFPHLTLSILRWTPVSSHGLQCCRSPQVLTNARNHQRMESVSCACPNAWLWELMLCEISPQAHLPPPIFHLLSPPKHAPQFFHLVKKMNLKESIIQTGGLLNPGLQTWIPNISLLSCFGTRWLDLIVPFFFYFFFFFQTNLS